MPRHGATRRPSALMSQLCDGYDGAEVHTRGRWPIWTCSPNTKFSRQIVSLASSRSIVVATYSRAMIDRCDRCRPHRRPMSGSRECAERGFALCWAPELYAHLSCPAVHATFVAASLAAPAALAHAEEHKHVQITCGLDHLAQLPARRAPRLRPGRHLCPSVLGIAETATAAEHDPERVSTQERHYRMSELASHGASGPGQT